MMRGIRPSAVNRCKIVPWRRTLPQTGRKSAPLRRFWSDGKRFFPSKRPLVPQVNSNESEPTGGHLCRFYATRAFTSRTLTSVPSISTSQIRLSRVILRERSATLFTIRIRRSRGNIWQSDRNAQQMNFQEKTATVFLVREFTGSCQKLVDEGAYSSHARKVSRECGPRVTE